MQSTDGEILVLDAKVTLDETAEFRHNGFPEPGHSDNDVGELAVIASEHNLNQLKLDGSVWG